VEVLVARVTKRTTRCRTRPGTAQRVAAVAADPRRAGVLAGVLKALGNPGRLRILAYLLGRGEGTVTDVAKALGLPQAVTSQQLGVLRLNGLVRVRRDGGFRHYAVALPVMADLVGCLARCYEEHRGSLQQNVG
jgi:DNA-binding transcriptional ArsR family regulator